MLLRRIAQPDKFLNTNDTIENSMITVVMKLPDIEYQKYVGVDYVTANAASKAVFETIASNKKEEYELIHKVALTNDDAELDKLIEQLEESGNKLIIRAWENVKDKFTPQQIEKMKELRLINSSQDNRGNGLFDFGQYDEPLNLTDEQKKKITLIRNEYIKEVAPLLQKTIETMNNYAEAAEDKVSGVFAGSEKGMVLAMAREEAKAPIVKLNTATREKILALFTEEQTQKLNSIMDGIPKNSGGTY
jgi:predicted 3-demethylubiquinone-9 3-methyltransferase (glyoxalase superfamily)